jgi:hypothetical protein
MRELKLPDGQLLYYEYDPVQDMLYVLLRPDVGATYYRDMPDQPGVMLRYEGATDELVGLTVHNVQRKLICGMVAELGERVLSKAA